MTRCRFERVAKIGPKCRWHQCKGCKTVQLAEQRGPKRGAMPLFREWRQRLAESGYRDLEVLGLDVERLSGNKGGAPRTGDLRPEYLECLTRDRQEVSVVATYAINPRTEALLRAHHDMPGLTGVETEVLWLLGYEGMSFPQAERQSGLGRFPIWQLVKRALAWDKRNGS